MTAEFNDWWDSGALLPDNPYVKDSPAFWAWAGWQACIAAEMPGKVITVPYLMELAGYLRKEKMEEAVKAEREACARVCEQYAEHQLQWRNERPAELRAMGANEAAEAIRARGAYET